MNSFVELFKLAPELVTFLAIFTTGAVIFVRIFQIRAESKQTSERLTVAESKVEREPDKARFAWDLARITLESYFNRNLRQVSAIFYLSAAVMLVGVGIITWGITQAIQRPDSTLPAVITGLSGVVTELIGATFLFLYRSTMQQAASYTRTLERINSVGMAMQILDTMPGGDTEGCLKNNVKAEVVRMLMRHAHDELPASMMPTGRP
jgi:nitrate reductase gamma subunit